MFKRAAGLLAWALLGWAGFAHALGLGEIESQSRLNQLVRASIPILSASGAELDSVTVQLASNEDFERAGMERTEFLSSLKFAVDGETVRVTSKQIAREPFVSFLLDVRWSGGRLLREYTLLLDPPGLATKGSGISQPTLASQMPTPPPAPADAPPSETTAAAEPSAEQGPVEAAEPAPAATPAAPATTAEGMYGPVAPQETLWSIAYKLRPDPATITMDQMQVAILNANPKAFHGGQISGLMKGVTLRIPSSEEIRAVDPVAAKALVARAREGGGSVAAAPPPAPAPVESAPPPAEAAPPPQPAPEVAATPPPPPPEAASIPPPAETAPSGTPPPSETAAAPPAETATPPPAESAAPPPPAAEPTPAPVEKPAPKIEEGPGLVESILSSATAALENPMLQYAVGGLVALLILGFVGKKVSDKIAQARYNRASKQVEEARTGGGATPVIGDSEVTQVAPSEPPSMEAALEAAGDAPTVVSGGKLAATVAMGSDTMQQTMQQTQVQEPPQAQTGGRAVDFDVTSNFASETVQINLDAGDPLSEAEFHRAYGLYDEAALMLKQALAKDPNRTDAKIKLAEIYFEAGKANEFVEVAKELKGQLPPDKWQPIALLGSQIAPNNELFSGAGAGGVGATVDLSFDEPAAAAPTAAPSAPAAPAAAPAAGDSLEFDLGSLSLDTGAAAAPAAPAAAPAASAQGESLEFDLGSFETPAAAPAEPAPAAPAADPGASLDLGDFDLSGGGGASPEASGGEVVDMSAPADDGLSAPADETGTKLDLARAYLDMGDSDMAKSLLNEVAQQGNDAQKKEAEELLKRASA